MTTHKIKSKLNKDVNKTDFVGELTVYNLSVGMSKKEVIEIMF